jgi:hypothetical protein
VFGVLVRQSFCNIGWMRNVFRLAVILFLIASTVRIPAQTKSHATVAVKSKAEACGPAVDGTLKCPRFAFTYKSPFGWVDRTDEMQGEDTGTEAGKPQTGSATSGKPETLLAIFERPPGAPGDTINSAVVIAAESLSDYHGVKQASDYFGPISELAEQRGFKVVSHIHSRLEPSSWCAVISAKNAAS